MCVCMCVYVCVCVSSHTEELWYNETVCVWMTIHAPQRGLSTLAKEFTAATRIMQRSSNELSTLVSGKAKI